MHTETIATGRLTMAARLVADKLSQPGYVDGRNWGRRFAHRHCTLGEAQALAEADAMLTGESAPDAMQRLADLLQRPVADLVGPDNYAVLTDAFVHAWLEAIDTEFDAVFAEVDAA